MATQIGDLFVRIGADVTGFDKGFGKVEISLKSLSEAFSKFKASLSPKMVVDAAYQIGKAFYNMADETATARVRLMDMAQSMGMTVEQLSALEYAARESRVGVAVFDQGMQKLNRNMAIANGGGSTGPFDRLGVQIFDLNNNLKPTGKLLPEIADKFKTMKDGAEKSALAAEIFGEQAGPKMLVLLNQGSAGLANYEKKARAVGQVLSNEDTAAALRFKNQISDLNEELEKNKNLIGGELIPVFTTYAEFLNEAAGGNFWEDLKAVFSVGPDVDTLNRSLGENALANQMAGETAEQFGERLALVSERAETARQELAELNKPGDASNVVEQINRIENAARGAAEAANGASEALATLTRDGGMPEDWASEKYDLADPYADPGTDTYGLLEKTKPKGVGGGGETKAQRLAREKKEREAQLREIEDSLKTETKLEEEAWERKSNFIKQAALRDNETREERNALHEAAEKAHFERLAEIEIEANAERENRLQDIRDSFKDEMTLADEQHQEEMDFLDQAKADKELSFLEHHRLTEEAEKAHAERIKKIQEKAADDEIAVSNHKWHTMLKNQSTALKNVAADFNNNMDIIFQSDKTYATAMAIMDGIASIQSSFKFGSKLGGPALGAAMAAVAAAAVWKNVEAINAVQPGSGGGKKHGGGGGGGAPVASAPSAGGGQDAGAAAGGGGGFATINIVGGDAAIFTGAQVRALIEQVNEQLDKGMTLRVA